MNRLHTGKVVVLIEIMLSITYQKRKRKGLRNNNIIIIIIIITTTTTTAFRAYTEARNAYRKERNRVHAE
jgi:uncharacterized membrane protein YkvI